LHAKRHLARNEMKIGLLAYHSACNFGATLQLLSTYMYLRKSHHDPIVINWTPSDFEYDCLLHTPQEQYACQKTVREQFWKETELCRTAEEIAQVIEKEKIEAVIIGSDAVAQHHPLLERIAFPCRTIIAINKHTSDRTFPNSFWGIWQDHLSHPIPMALMSASCQDSSYKQIPAKTRREMEKRIMRFDYLSVRDSWTRDMMSFLTHEERRPDITPDPVFAFNQNASELVPSRQETLQKFQLPENYILLSFLNKHKPSVSQEWLDEFRHLAQADHITCVMLPFSNGKSFGKASRSIDLPLTPVDWFALIKYSSGYVGNNMHPIIASMLNHVPFFSFDTYGTSHITNIWANDQSSKIKHILTSAGFSDYRASDITYFSEVPHAADVYEKLKTFDHAKSDAFTQEYLDKYNRMMNDILQTFTRIISTK